MTKTILITGATDGIGLLTAKMLSEQGHKVLLHGRNPQKLQAAAAQMTGDTETFCADLSSLKETKKLTKDVLAATEHLDVLINNAGVLKAPNPMLGDGQDIRFVVNTLAPLALTQALLPIMPTDGRILNLSSAAQATVNLDAMRGAVQLDDMSAYSQSKRAITLWTAALAQANPSGPVFIAVNPGSLLASKLVKEGFGIAGHDLSIGADILCSLALDDGFADASGKYWDNDARSFSRLDLSQVKEVMELAHELIE